MTIKKWPLLIFVFLFISHAAFAQNKELPFKLVEGNGGKPLGQINGITQDADGYMWMVSPGLKCLYRYDGTRVVRYSHDPTNPNTLGGSDPESVFADPNGFIWIGLTDHGLDKLDPSTGTFTHYVHNEKDSE